MRRWAGWALVLVLFGCGDDDDAAVDASVDAAVDASVDASGFVDPCGSERSAWLAALASVSQACTVGTDCMQAGDGKGDTCDIAYQLHPQCGHPVNRTAYATSQAKTLEAALTGAGSCALTPHIDCLEKSVDCVNQRCTLVNVPCRADAGFP